MLQKKCLYFRHCKVYELISDSLVTSIFHPLVFLSKHRQMLHSWLVRAGLMPAAPLLKSQIYNNFFPIILASVPSDKMAFVYPGDLCCP